MLNPDLLIQITVVPTVPTHPPDVLTNLVTLPSYPPTALVYLFSFYDCLQLVHHFCHLVV